MTVTIIAANVVVWLWQVRTGIDRTVLHDGYYPCSLRGPCRPPASEFHHLHWWQGAFTSMFMHGGWVHIGGNMLFLWIFGNNVEDAMGRVRFALWYVASGLAATALQTAVTLHFSNPSGASIPNVGASGAIAGVLGAYLLLLPRARVLTAIIFGLILIREIPAIWFLGVWFLFQAWDGGFAVVHPQQGGGVAFFAHIGGFLFGMATVYLVAVRRPLQPSY